MTPGVETVVELALETMGFWRTGCGGTTVEVEVVAIAGSRGGIAGGATGFTGGIAGFTRPDTEVPSPAGGRVAASTGALLGV